MMGRDELTALAVFLAKVIDSATTDPAIREHAQRWFDEVDIYMATNEIDPVPPLSLTHLCCGYRQWVEDVLAELPPDVVAEQVVRVTMVHAAAETADSPMFSDNMRLEIVDSIWDILQSLERCAAESLEDTE